MATTGARALALAAPALLAMLTSGCANRQTIPLDCLTQEVRVYVDGRLLEENPDVLQLRADEPHMLYFKRPGHEPELVVLDSLEGPDGRAVLSPADVCVELRPVGVERTLEVEAEGEDEDATP